MITSCSSAEIGSLNLVHCFRNEFCTIPSSWSNFLIDILYQAKNLSSYLWRSGYSIKNSPFSNRKLFMGCTHILLTFKSIICIIKISTKWRLLHCIIEIGIFPVKILKEQMTFAIFIELKRVQHGKQAAETRCNWKWQLYFLLAEPIARKRKQCCFRFHSEIALI